MKSLLATVKSLWNKLPDSARRIVHTFWQAFLGVFVLGVTSVLSNLLSTGNFSTAKSALVALVSAAVAAAFAAVKALLVSRN